MLNVKGIDIEDDDNMGGTVLRPSDYRKTQKKNKKCC